MFDQNDITKEEKEQIARRFIRYASIGTQSADGFTKTPSTPQQRILAEMLYRELQDMGAADVYYDEKYCYVYATLPSNLPKPDPALMAACPDRDAKKRENLSPIIGLVAHIDTSDAVPSDEVHPQLIECYDGNEICLNEALNIKSSPSEMPDLSLHKGQMLITSDGTSVLGGDDKAGVTEIMELFKFYLTHPAYPHGTVRLMFTPDEEVGNGTACYDREHFQVDFAYTCDGGAVGELEYENFNAATAILTIHGKNTHPGSAKGVMKNALLYGMEFNSLLPAKETPFYTEGYEGFFHLENMSGTPEEAKMEYLIRDHDRDHFEKRKALFADAVKDMQHRYGEECFEAQIQDSYYNMIEKIRPHMHLIDNAVSAMKALGVAPRIAPIRGGTDGCRLSFEGIPCPNLGTGAYHWHSRNEYVCVEEMALAVRILARILEKYAAFSIDVK